MTEHEEIWDKQPGETAKAWAAFQAYRDLGSSRTMSATLQFLNRKETDSSKRLFYRWASDNNWYERVRQYDIYVDRKQRIELEERDRAAYATKIEAYRQEVEEASTRMMDMAANAMTLAQANLTVRLAAWTEAAEAARARAEGNPEAEEDRERTPPTPLEISELCVLMRSAIACMDVATKIRGDSLGIDQLVDSLVEGKDKSKKAQVN